MVAYVGPRAQTYSRPACDITELQGSAVAAVATAPESQSHGSGLTRNHFGNRTAGLHNPQFPPLAVPKPEPQQFREVEREGAEYDFYLHSRKRSKLYDPSPPSVLQSCMPPPATRLPPFTVTHGSGHGSTPASRYSDPQQSLLGKSGRIFPASLVSVPTSPCNPLEEPSPLGLTLKKTPSLLDLISFQLQHNSAAAPAAAFENQDQGSGKSRIGKCLAPTGAATQDKLKASNFPASSLRVGTWERVSRYEGDLVAKCYYAKRKLVWEVLDSGLKSKIEIQWSDISAMKATCLDNVPGTLDIEVSRPPLFFKETNPQPRKHTLWQATSDFTGGQATVCKRHFLQFPEGVLNRHYEKLVQCDPRLKALVDGAFLGPTSHGDSDFLLDSQLAFRHPKSFNGLGHVFEGLSDQLHSPMSPYSPVQASMRSGSIVPDLETDLGSMDRHTSDISSPSSVMEIRGSEEGGNSDSDEYHMELATSSPFAIDPLCASSMNYDLHEMKPAWNMCPGNGDVSASNRKILDEIAQMLLGDSSATLSTEQALLLAARVGSMQAALARDSQTGSADHTTMGESFGSDPNYGCYGQNLGRSIGTEQGQADVCYEGLMKEQLPNSRLTKSSTSLDPSFNSVMQCLSKNSSTGDLLMNLPRVASLPQLFESVSQVPFSRYMGIQ